MQLQIAPNDNVFRINSPEIRSLFLTKRQFLFVPFGPRNPKIQKRKRKKKKICPRDGSLCVLEKEHSGQQ
jgi:hypothetical protein